MSTAKYRLHIHADSGYSSTAEGTCNPEQYGVAMAALNGNLSESFNLLLAAPGMLETLEKIAQINPHDTSSMGYVVELARAAVAKANGESL